MRSRLQFAVLILGVIALSTFLVSAQSAPQTKEAQGKEKEKQEQPKPSTPQVSPETKAFTDARRITDPAKRIEALEKFKADFPDSKLVEGADQMIFVAAVIVSPKDKEKIMALAKAAIGPPPHNDTKTGVFNTVADRLMEAGIFLDEAEQFAKEGIALFDKSKYIERMKKIYETAKRPVPSDEQLTKQFLSSRALNITTLGEIYMKQGKQAEAEKLFKEIFEDAPSTGLVAGYLAEIAEKKGDDAEAFKYLTTAALSGPMKPEARSRFEALYRKTHNGSLDGFEAMLDAKYKKEFPNPLKLEHYKPTASRSNRVVLAEIFTGSGCPPCVAADLAFEAMMERYSTSDVAIIMYHLHIPRPDPMTNPSTEARSKFYGVRGVPSYVLDGKLASGGGPRSNTQGFYDRVNPDVEKRLEEAAEAELSLGISLEGRIVRVKAGVDKIKSESPDLKLQIALVEEHLTYNGENGIRYHPMVVRSLGGENAGGFAIENSKATSVEHTFDLAKISEELKAHLDDYETRRKITFGQKKHEIDAGGLSVVAFVQDTKTKQILQAAFVKVKAEAVESNR
ncbi:MAG: hypothetical protein L0229_17715 [Blastocatellia bacterium]|nr:hypothetical protein [Blastocatellia bacterium]